MSTGLLVFLGVLFLAAVGFIVWLLSQEGSATSRVSSRAPQPTLPQFPTGPKTPLPPPPPPPPIAVLAPSVRTNAAIAEAKAGIARRKSEIEMALARFHSVNFEALTRLHYEAFTMADNAYALYKETRASSRATSKSIEQLDGYARKLATGIDRRDPRYLERKRSAQQSRAQLVSTAQGLQASCQELLDGVRTLNAKTHTLKERIRQECGQRGQDWYMRLERRIRDSQ